MYCYRYYRAQNEGRLFTHIKVVAVNSKISSAKI